MAVEREMTRSEIEDCLNRAMDVLFQSDLHLLDVDSSERSISHCFAVHLMRQVPGYDVDCEYNRDGFDVKRLSLSVTNTTADSTEAVTVFPDIIVHRRGTNAFNLLAIEIKKSSSNVSKDFDIQKLKAFRQELKYTYAVHLTIGKGQNGAAIRDVDWVS